MLWYMATHDFLKHQNLEMKFIAVKSVIFFTYCQSLVSPSPTQPAAHPDFSSVWQSAVLGGRLRCGFSSARKRATLTTPIFPTTFLFPSWCPSCIPRSVD